MLKDTRGIQVLANVNAILIEECTSVINETMINNKDNITNNNNTYLILFIVFLIGFIYYYCRNNANKRKLRDFIYPKTKTSIY